MTLYTIYFALDLDSHRTKDARIQHAQRTCHTYNSDIINLIPLSPRPNDGICDIIGRYNGIWRHVQYTIKLLWE